MRLWQCNGSDEFERIDRKMGKQRRDREDERSDDSQIPTRSTTHRYPSDTIPSYPLLQKDVTINEYLPDELEYHDLAEFLRAGGRLEIGECHETKSFARLRIERTSLEVAKMNYKDFADVLREMNSQARQYAERNW
jgi:hypothetical protein